MYIVTFGQCTYGFQKLVSHDLISSLKRDDISVHVHGPK